MPDIIPPTSPQPQRGARPAFEYGEPTVYEITWQSGHVETVIAHQVSWPNNGAILLLGASKPSRIQFHAEVDGRWTLQLSALEEDLRTIRNITSGEHIVPEGGAL